MSEKKPVEDKNDSNLLGLPKGVEPFLDRIVEIVSSIFLVIFVIAIIGSIISSLLDGKDAILGVLYVIWEGIVWLFSKIWWVVVIFIIMYAIERITYQASLKALRDFHARNNHRE